MPLPTLHRGQRWLLWLQLDGVASTTNDQHLAVHADAAVCAGAKAKSEGRRCEPRAHGNIVDYGSGLKS